MCLNNKVRSFFGFSDNSSFSDFNFFDVVAVEAVGDSLGEFGFVFGIGEQGFSSSNFELDGFFILLDIDG